MPCLSAPWFDGITPVPISHPTIYTPLGGPHHTGPSPRGSVPPSDGHRSSCLTTGGPVPLSTVRALRPRRHVTHPSAKAPLPGQVERAGHRMSPITFHPWITPDGPHHLCPVAALTAYISATRAYSGPNLWVDPRSLRGLKTLNRATKLVQWISLADPQSRPKAHQVRMYAPSLAFFRSFDVDQVQRAGQGSSSYCFVNRYLQIHLSNIPCVAMGSSPDS